MRKGDIDYFANDKFMYAKERDEVFKLAIFENGYYKLRLFNGIPILEIDGLRMHLVKGFKSPLDYASKVIAALEISKKHTVLDTCMGLGYTAIEAAKKSSAVVTCEISEAVLSLAQMNPWSNDLFEDNQIEVMHGDISKKIHDIDDSSFNIIIHDPPRFSKAGELYSLEFYKQLYRILKRNGKLFHYVGSLGKNKGRKIHQEVAKRLKEAGFKKVLYKKQLQGLLALK
jgi:predicted methyltransferase